MKADSKHQIFAAAASTPAQPSSDSKSPVPNILSITPTDQKQSERNRRIVTEFMDNASNAIMQYPDDKKATRQAINFKKRKNFFQLTHGIRKAVRNASLTLNFIYQERQKLVKGKIEEHTLIHADELIDLYILFFLTRIAYPLDIKLTEKQIDKILSHRLENFKNNELHPNAEYLFQTEHGVWLLFLTQFQSQSQTGIKDQSLFLAKIFKKLENLDDKKASEEKSFVALDAPSEDASDATHHQFLRDFDDRLSSDELACNGLINEINTLVAALSEDWKVLFKSFQNQSSHIDIIERACFYWDLKCLLSAQGTDIGSLPKSILRREKDLLLAKAYMSPSGYKFYKVIEELKLLKEVVVRPETLNLINEAIKLFEKHPQEGVKLVSTYQIGRITEALNEDEIEQVLLQLFTMCDSHDHRCLARSIMDQRNSDQYDDDDSYVVNGYYVNLVDDEKSGDSPAVVLERSRKNARQLIDQIKAIPVNNHFTTRDQWNLKTILVAAQFAVDNHLPLNKIHEVLIDVKVALEENKPKLLLSCYQAQAIHSVYKNYVNAQLHHNSHPEKFRVVLNAIQSKASRFDEKKPILWKSSAITLNIVNKAVTTRDAASLNALRVHIDQVEGASTWSTFSAVLKGAVAAVCLTIPILGWAVLYKITQRTGLSKSLSDLHTQLQNTPKEAVRYRNQDAITPPGRTIVGPEERATVRSAPVAASQAVVLQLPIASVAVVEQKQSSPPAAAAQAQSQPPSPPPRKGVASPSLVGVLNHTVHGSSGSKHKADSSSMVKDQPQSAMHEDSQQGYDCLP